MFLPNAPYCIKDSLEVCMRADLEYWRNIWFWGLAASGAIVLIGVMCEYPEVKHEFIRWLPTRLWYRTFFKHEIKEKPTWVPFWGVVGLLVIVVGLAGEILCEVLVFGADNQISVFEGFVLNEARRETAVAYEAAGLASLEAAQANERTAKLAKEAEAERLSRVKIEARVAWRQLTEQQKKDLANKLKKYPLQRAEIRYNDGDSEAAAFASSIADALTRANWQVPTPEPLPLIFNGAPLPSTAVGIQGDVFTVVQCALLIKLLNDAGFDADGGFTWQVMPSLSIVQARTIAIAVKHRPEGPQGEYKLQAELEARAKKPNK